MHVLRIGNEIIRIFMFDNILLSDFITDKNRTHSDGDRVSSGDLTGSQSSRDR